MNFSLASHPAMVMGAGVSRQTGDHVSTVCGGPSKVLVVVDPAIRELGVADNALNSLEDSGHEVKIFSDLKSDPQESSVDAATAIAHAMGADCIVGIGGGSAMDTSKVVAALADSGNGCAAYRLSATPWPYRKTALITLPTTAGTGSETTPTSIISQDNGIKNWFWGPALKTDLAIMDPELTVGLPAYWTFYTGMDALVHSIESRTNRYRYGENDIYAESGIRNALQYLELAVKEPDNIEARSGMMLAAAYGGLAISNTGCAVAHNIGHALGSIAAVPHGRAVSVALARTWQWVLPGNPSACDDVARLAGVAKGSDVEGVLDGLADRCGEILALSDDERAKVDASTLASDMVADANISMLEATARDASQEDVEALAQMVA